MAEQTYESGREIRELMIHAMPDWGIAAVRHSAAVLDEPGLV